MIRWPAKWGQKWAGRLHQLAIRAKVPGTPLSRRALVPCPVWLTSAGHSRGSTEPRLPRRGSFYSRHSRNPSLLNVGGVLAESSCYTEVYTRDPAQAHRS